jgi:hypothetical protein
MEVPLADAVEAVELGYFFRTAAATRFSAAGHAAPGYASTVAVAQLFGVVVFSDTQGA